jgi:hypothetical protein
MQPRQKKNATVDETVAPRDAAGSSNLLPLVESEKALPLADELQCLWEQKSALSRSREQELNGQVASANQAFARAVARDAGPLEIRRCEAAIDAAHRALNLHRAEWRKTQAPLLRALRVAGDRGAR